MGYKVYWRKAFTDSVRKAEYRLKRAKKLQQHFPHQVWTGVVADAEEQLYIAKLYYSTLCFFSGINTAGTSAPESSFLSFPRTIKM